MTLQTSSNFVVHLALTAGGCLNCRGLFSEETIMRNESNTVSLMKCIKWCRNQIRSEESKKSHDLVDKMAAAMSKTIPSIPNQAAAPGAVR